MNLTNSKNRKIKNLIGYVQNNPFGIYNIPVKFQNQLLKNFCEDNNFLFSLPQGELTFSKNFIQLNTLIKNLKINDAIVTCSIYMLPDKKNLRNKFYKLILKKKIEFYFIFENLRLKSKNDMKKIEEYFVYDQLSKHSVKIFNNLKKK